MRRLIKFMLILTVIATGSSVVRAQDHLVTIPHPTLVEVADVHSLRDLCHVGRDIYGCTMFAYAVIDCHCDPRGNGYVLHAAPMAVPVIFFERDRVVVVAHELLHIEDVKSSLRQYVTSLADPQYESRAQCENAAAEAASHKAVAARLDDYMKSSNAKYRCHKQLPK